MITVKKIGGKNIMSIGNKGFVLDLDTHKTNLITGKNGAGKSTILIESLTFGLFGKPYRKINKPQLVNTINKKGLIVEVWFEVGGDEYYIKRGIGPNVFEIHKNGTLIPEDAASGDYQDYLENTILNLTYKTFKQIVVLGTAGFTPFMQLTAPQRREVIEDLLDIQVFSHMTDLNKKRLGVVQSDILQVEGNINLLSDKLEIYQKQQSDGQDEVAARVADQQSKLAAVRADLEKFLAELEPKRAIYHKLSGALSDAAYTALLPKLYAGRGKLQGVVDADQKMINFFKDHDDCPVCQQSIDSTFKQNKMFSLEMNIDETKMNLTRLVESIESNEKTKARDAQIKDKMYEISDEIASIESKIKICENNIELYEGSLEELSKKTFKDLSAQIKAIEAKLHDLGEHRLDLMNDKYCHSVVTAILKDSGVKSVIINQYIPVINKLINDNLAKLGAAYTFELDSEFGESIKSRGMENFSYNSFSQGQKFRIDIAILFAWRELVQMKAGSSFNLLVLDEVMDSSADQDGIDALVEILNQLDDKVYIISHNEKLDAMDFDRRIDVQMKGRFSEIEITV